MPTSKDRPRAWNDDVIWLLARIAGLFAGQGAGTPSGAIPLGIATSEVNHYLRLTPAGQGAASVVELQMPDTGAHWALVSCQLHHTGGAAATWAPRWGQVAGFANDGPEDRLGLSSQATTTPYRKVFCNPVTMRPDGAGKLYFKPGLDAGADNALDLQFWFRQVIVTEGST